MTFGGRFSSYSRAGDLKTWKVGVDAQLNDSVRLRSTFSHDVREASFGELFVGTSGGATVIDPFNNGASVAVSVWGGGNPDLYPEEAETVTAGVVYTPTGVPGLALSVDYYDIDLTETIGNLGSQRIVDSCFTIQVHCEMVRFYDNGTVQGVLDTFVNINAARVAGTDLELSYSAQPNWFSNADESLSLRFLVGYLQENSSTPLGGVKQDLAGVRDIPEWTTTTNLNYVIGPWTASIQHFLIPSSKLDVTWVEGVHIDDNTIDGVDYVNLGLRYSPLDAKWTIFGNIVNAFDDHPPAIAAAPGRSLPSTFALNTHNSIMLGRRYVVGASFEF